MRDVIQIVDENDFILGHVVPATAGQPARLVPGPSAEWDALRRDAERYRHLRQVGLVLDGHDFISYDEIADQRVDAAMARAACPAADL